MTQVIWVGCVFAIEVLEIYRPRFEFIFEILLAVLGAEIASRYVFPAAPSHPQFDVSFDGVPQLLLGALLVGLGCGFLARFLVQGIHFFKKLFLKSTFQKYHARSIIVILMSALAFFNYESPYLGLGYSYVHSAFETGNSVWMAPLKIFWSAISLGIGFKGGEFVPSVFAGSFAGNSISQVLGIAPHPLAALGFGAVFGAAANIPVTATLLACGLFGFKILPFAALTSAVAFFVSGPVSIYAAQGGLHRKKNIFAKIF